MKLVALSLLCVSGLVGCGTLATPEAANTAAATPATASNSQIDYVLMDLVDQAARRRGVQVVWINAPRKAVPAGS